MRRGYEPVEPVVYPCLAPLLGALYVPRKTLNNVLQAVLTRAVGWVYNKGSYTPVIQPRKYAWGGPLLRSLGSLLVRRTRPTTWKTVWDYISKLHRDGVRTATLYEQVAVDMTWAGDSARARDRRFQKLEKLTKYDTSPRLIQGLSEIKTLLMGRAIRHLFGRLKDMAVRLLGYQPFASGLNARGVGRLVYNAVTEMEGWVAYGLDATKFDAHVSQASRRFENRCWTRLVPDAPGLAKLLREMLETHGKIRVRDGWIQFKVKGTRNSGEIQTSAGNNLHMFVMWCVVAARLALGTGVLRAHGRAGRHSGVTDYLHRYTADGEWQSVFTWAKTRFRLIVNGDDCVHFVHPNLCSLYERIVAETYADMGFTIKLEPPVKDIHDIEFCQCKFAWVDGEIHAVPGPQFLNKVSLTLKRFPPGSRSFRRQQKAVSVALRKGWGWLPLVAALADAMDNEEDPKLCKLDTEHRGLGILSHGMVSNGMSSASKARDSYQRMFGIDHDVQCAMEHAYRTHDYLLAADCGSLLGLAPPVYERAI